MPAKKSIFKKKKKMENATRVVVLGAGQVGIHVSQTLSIEGYNVLLIDEDELKIQEAKETADLASLVANGCNPEIYIQIGLSEKDLFVAVTDSDETNLVACRIAKAFGCKIKIARVRKVFYRNFENSPINEKFWRKLGVEVLFNQELLTALEIDRLIESPGAIDTVSLLDDRLQIIGYRVKEDSVLNGRRLVGLRDIALFENLIVAAVNASNNKARDDFSARKGSLSTSSKEETLVPHGDYKIQEGDLLYICGRKENFNGVGALFDPDIHKGFKHLFILGGSLMAYQLAQTLCLKYARKTIYLIEADKGRAYEASDKLNPRIHILHMDVRNVEELIQEGLNSHCIFIGASTNEDDNLMASVLVKEETGARTIALIQNPTYLHIAPYLDVDAVVSPKLLLAEEVLKALQRHEYDVVSARGSNTEILDFIVFESSKVAYQKLNTLNFPENSVTLAIFRGEEIIIPQGETSFLPKDHVLVFALKHVIKNVQVLFQER